MLPVGEIKMYTYIMSLDKMLPDKMPRGKLTAGQNASKKNNPTKCLSFFCS